MQVLWRNNVGEPWTLLASGVKRDRHFEQYFVHANIDHFSQGCLGKKLDLQNKTYTDVVKRGRRPHAMELEFVNATDKNVIFLVLPTRYSMDAVTSLAVGVQVQGHGGNVEIERQVADALMSAATDCQAIVVHAKVNKGATPKVRDRCPFEPCFLLAEGTSQARVALVTAEEGEVLVWVNQLYVEKTQLVILPRMFDDPCPVAKRKLPAGLFDVAKAAGMDQSAPVANISTAGSSVAAAAQSPL